VVKKKIKFIDVWKCHKKKSFSGDARADEAPNLGTNHLLFVRQHNKIAKRLQEINQNWSDETIFQETRKIIGAIIQHVTYNEYLPNILGYNLVRSSGLSVCKGRRFPNKYNPDIDPTIRNGFAAGVFRVGHTMIPPDQCYLKNNYITIEKNSLSDQFFNTHMIVQGGGEKMTQYARWLTYDGCMITDR
jgi:hypothetical protein